MHACHVRVCVFGMCVCVFGMWGRVLFGQFPGRLFFIVRKFLLLQRKTEGGTGMDAGSVGERVSGLPREGEGSCEAKGAKRPCQQAHVTGQWFVMAP